MCPYCYNSYSPYYGRGHYGPYHHSGYYGPNMYYNQIAAINQQLINYGIQQSVYQNAVNNQLLYRW